MSVNIHAYPGILSPHPGVRYTLPFRFRFRGEAGMVWIGWRCVRVGFAVWHQDHALPTSRTRCERGRSGRADDLAIIPHLPVVVDGVDASAGDDARKVIRRPEPGLIQPRGSRRGWRIVQSLTGQWEKDHTFDRCGPFGRLRSHPLDSSPRGLSSPAVIVQTLSGLS